MLKTGSTVYILSAFNRLLDCCCTGQKNHLPSSEADKIPMHVTLLIQPYITTLVTEKIEYYMKNRILKDTETSLKKHALLKEDDIDIG